MRKRAKDGIMSKSSGTLWLTLLLERARHLTISIIMLLLFSQNCGILD